MTEDGKTKGNLILIEIGFGARRRAVIISDLLLINVGKETFVVAAIVKS